LRKAASVYPTVLSPSDRRDFAHLPFLHEALQIADCQSLFLESPNVHPAANNSSEAVAALVGD
jgi:hypothetical protein